MAWTVLLLSDQYTDVRDLLGSFPSAPYRVVTMPLKETDPTDLIRIHPDVLMIDGTGDVTVANRGKSTAEAVSLKNLDIGWDVKDVKAPDPLPLLQVGAPSVVARLYRSTALPLWRDTST